MSDTCSPHCGRGHSAPQSSLAVALLASAVLLVSAAASAQRNPQEPSGEIVANLAEGRVVWCVTRDAILVAAVEGGGERGSHPPAIVPISAYRMGVLLGAVDWAQGEAGKRTRLDAELPQVTANATRRPTETIKNSDGPSDIEEIGIGTLELMRPLVNQIHHKLDLAPNEPLVELLLADYVENYGPEIWSLQYRIRQQNLGNDYWDTQILRPAYYQLYPPEKGQPHTFMDAQYPVKLSPLGLAARLAQHDPQLAGIRDASPILDQAVTAILAGQSEKANSAPVADFLRAAVPATAGGQPKLILAKLDAMRGFQWILPPEEAPAPPAQTKPSEPGAPSLRKYVPPEN